MSDYHTLQAFECNSRDEPDGNYCGKAFSDFAKNPYHMFYKFHKLVHRTAKAYLFEFQFNKNMPLVTVWIPASIVLNFNERELTADVHHRTFMKITQEAYTELKKGMNK